MAGKCGWVGSVGGAQLGLVSHAASIQATIKASHLKKLASNWKLPESLTISPSGYQDLSIDGKMTDGNGSVDGSHDGDDQGEGDVQGDGVGGGSVQIIDEARLGPWEMTCAMPGPCRLWTHLTKSNKSSTHHGLSTSRLPGSPWTPMHSPRSPRHCPASSISPSHHS